MQFNQVAVLGAGTGQVLFNLLPAPVNQPQLLLVHSGGAVENLVNEPHLFAGAEIPHPQRGKIRKNRRINRTDSRNDLITQQNTQGDGCVYALAPVGHRHGNIDDDDGVAVLQGNAGGFFRVKRGLQVGRLDVQRGGHLTDLILVRGGQADPTAGRNCRHSQQLLIC